LSREDVVRPVEGISVCLSFDFDAMSSWIAAYRTHSPNALSRGEFGRVGAERLLALLAEHEIPTTWFVPGHTIEAFPATVERILTGGHELGHHGYCHEDPRPLELARERALLLLDTGPGYKKAEPREGWNRMAEERALELEARGFDALGRGAEVRLSRHRSAEGLARSARGTLRQFDSRVIESLPEIGVPALVLVGEQDKPFLAATDYMARKIPGARHVVIPGAGHASNIDQPEAFNEALRSFLETLD
jgi:dienelactone hydrolase